MLLKDFAKFCRVDLRLKEKTVYDHVRLMKKVLKWIKKPPEQITKNDIRKYLLENKV